MKKTKNVMKRKTDKRRGKTIGMKGTGGSSSKTTGAERGNAMTISVAEKANAFSAGDNSACSNRGSGEDKYGSSVEIRHGCSSKKESLCNRNRLGEELLCLWEFWAYGPPL